MAENGAFLNKFSLLKEKEKGEHGYAKYKQQIA